MRTRTLGALVAAALMGTALTGCASGVEPAAAPAPTPSETVTVEPMPTTADLPAGTVITNDQRKEIEDVEGVGAYHASDGTFILVRADQPLPETVKQDVATRMYADATLNAGRLIPPGSSASQMAKKLSKQSGRNVVIIDRLIPDSQGLDAPDWPVYLTRPQSTGYHETLEEAQAAALAAAGGDPSTVDFIHVDYGGWHNG